MNKIHNSWWFKKSSWVVWCKVSTFGQPDWRDSEWA